MKQRLVCLALTLALLASCGTAAGAAARDETLAAPLHLTNGRAAVWDFPYSDAYFSSPATVYNHDLARASLGLAVAAYRQADADLAHKDRAVRAYLTDAGFADLVSAQYDVTPTADTIATMIGRKDTPEGTIVAVAVSGGDYALEWASNFTVGAKQYDDNDSFHEGFASAAGLVADRVAAYLRALPAGRQVKIWLTGYSRSAAVANLTAFVLLLTGAAQDDSLYAYTFATPRCTKEKSMRDCPGVFNIVGAFDPVPVVPFPEWGYDRFGVTLYLPAQELCADYAARAQRADAVSRALTGDSFLNNPQANWLTLKAMQATDEVMTGSSAYRDNLQAIVLTAMNAGLPIPLRLLRILLQIQQNPGLTAMADDVSLNTDILVSASAWSLFRQATGGEKNLWTRGNSLVHKLFREHYLETYIIWLFSEDDPDRLYVTDLDYHELVYPAGVTARVRDAAGTAYGDAAGFRLGDAQLLFLPASSAWNVDFTAGNATDFHVTAVEKTAQHLTAPLVLFDSPGRLEAGQTASLTLRQGLSTATDLFELTVDGQTYEANPLLEEFGLSEDYSALEAAESGPAAKAFAGNALRGFLLILGLALCLLCTLFARIWRRLRRRSGARAKG